ncbi:MAG: hypothetical protein ACLFVW_05800, partial [Phycisphaerae bacterium]
MPDGLPELPHLSRPYKLLNNFGLHRREQADKTRSIRFAELHYPLVNKRGQVQSSPAIGSVNSRRFAGYPGR